jgi:hypothetical protein
MIPRLAKAIVMSFSIATLGCNSQPASPSGLSLSGAPDLMDATPRVAAAQTVMRSAAGGRPASAGVVYVTSQGLYFDTFAARDPLPMKGTFQLLENGTTEFGPGDPGYLGGRWWEDLNGNGVQDEGDHFFLCPLLPPGRPTP